MDLLKAFHSNPPVDLSYTSIIFDRDIALISGRCEIVGNPVQFFILTYVAFR